MGCDCGCGGNPNCWCQRQQGPAREEHFRIIMETAEKEGLLPQGKQPLSNEIKEGELPRGEKSPKGQKG